MSGVILYPSSVLMPTLIIVKKANETILQELFLSQHKKWQHSFEYAKRMLPLFCAVVKFCSTNRLFNYFSIETILVGNSTHKQINMYKVYFKKQENFTKSDAKYEQ